MADLPMVDTQQFNYASGTSSPVRIAQETPNQAEGFKASITDLPDGGHRYKISQDGTYTSVTVDANNRATGPLNTTRGRVSGDNSIKEADKFAQIFAEAAKNNIFEPKEIENLRNYNNQSQTLPAGGVRVAESLRGGGVTR